MKRVIKRALKYIGALLLIFLIAIGSLGYSAFGGLVAIADGVEPAPGVRIVKDGIVSFGVVDIGDKKIALIDAGNDPTGKQVLSELTRRGLGPDAVTAIFFTHGHVDHTAGTSQFPKAETYVLEGDVALTEGREGGHGPITKMFPVKPTGIHVTHALHDGDSIVVGDKTVRVFAVPGHTAGSGAYLVAGVLFLGDSAAHKSDETLAGSPWALSDNGDQNHASLKALADRLRPEKQNIVAIVPAHSAVAKFDLLDNYKP